jgi:ribulose kinase
MSQNAYLLGVDVGTTGAKAVLTTDTGKIVAQHATEYGFLSPRPLRAEHHYAPDPRDAATYDRYCPHYLGLHGDLQQRFAAMADLAGA